MAHPPPSSHAQIREPKPYDGSDPCRLCQFLILCKLNFQDYPGAYSDDAAKIIYMLSFLKGTALDFFEPYLMDPRCKEAWMTDYSAFVKVLQENFGPHDPTATAKTDLKTLCMKENHKITKYIVEFNHLSVQTGCDPAML